jgi:hypothetical protein
MNGIDRETPARWIVDFFLKAALGVTGLLILFTHFERRTPDAIDIGILMGTLVSILLAVKLIFAVAHLARVARVLHGQRVPQTLWQASLRSECQALLNFYAVSAAFLAAYLFCAQTSSLAFLISVFYALALMSFCCLLGAGFAFAACGFLRQGWQRSVLLLYALSAIMLINPISRTALETAIAPLYESAFVTMGMKVMLAVIALAMPIMLLWQRHQASLAMPRKVFGKATRLVAWRQRLVMEFRRYTSMQKTLNPNPNPSIFHLILNQLILFLVPISMLPQRSLSLSGESHISDLRLFVMLFWSIPAMNYLVVRDVHWRYLLLPGGMERKQIANNILLSTLRLQGSILIPLAILISTMLFLFSPDNASTFIGGMLQYWRLAFEWVAILTLAIFMQTLERSEKIGVVIIFILLGSFFLIYFPLSRLQHELILFPANWIYITSLIAFSLLMMYVNNRRWTTELLFEKLKSNSV